MNKCVGCGVLTSNKLCERCFRIRNSGTSFSFRDKFEAFHAVVLLGRMFKE